MAKDKIKILMLSYDWGNIFEEDHSGLLRKLSRDHYDPERNDLFLFSWSSKNYFRKTGNVATVHLKAVFGRWRMLYDLLGIIAVPAAIALKRFRPDVIIINDFPSAISAALVRLFWKVRTVLVLGAMPSELAKTRRFWFPKWIYSRIAEIIGMQLIDHFVAIGEATKKYLSGQGARENHLTVMNPDTISPDKDWINNAGRGRAREKYGIGDDTKILLSVGRLQPEKNFDVLIKAFEIFKGEDVKLLIAGDGPLKQALEAVVQGLGLGNQVVFAGRLARQELWSHYRDADAFILLSKSEGLGLVFWEAIYAGVPVIGTRVGGIEDTIGAGEERGYFWDEKDGRERFKAIVEHCFIKTPDTEEKLRRAKEYVANKISNKIDINEIYEKHIINS